jgi:hypothetical protein
VKIVFFYSSNSDNNRKKFFKIVGKTLLITAGIAVSQGALPAFAAVDTSGAESIGYEIWRVVKVISMFILAGFIVKDILREANDSSLKDIGIIVVKYTAAWVVIVFIIKFFLWIEKLGS